MKTNHFTIIITGRNAVDWIAQCLASAITHDYPDFEIIYMDACSDDGTYEKACRIETRNSRKLSVLRNKTRQYQGANILEAAELAIPNSILVTLDGDDHFPDDQVLNKLNVVYQDDNIFMTYGGSYIEEPYRDVRNFYEAYPKAVVAWGAFREHRWLGSHLRSFRRELFLKINVEDLKDEKTNDFYSMAPDLGFMFPMLEMSRERAKYLNDVLYVYNRANENSEVNVNQAEIDRIEKQVRDKPRYSRLENLY